MFLVFALCSFSRPSPDPETFQPINVYLPNLLCIIFDLFFPTKAELSSCDRLYTKLKVFPNLFIFFKHRRQSLQGDSICLSDFSYFLAPGGRHTAHISVHSLRLLLNPLSFTVTDCGWTRATGRLWSSEDNLQEFVFSFQHVGSMN